MSVLLDNSWSIDQNNSSNTVANILSVINGYNDVNGMMPILFKKIDKKWYVNGSCNSLNSLQTDNNVFYHLYPMDEYVVDQTQQDIITFIVSNLCTPISRVDLVGSYTGFQLLDDSVLNNSIFDVSVMPLHNAPKIYLGDYVSVLGKTIDVNGSILSNMHDGVNSQDAATMSQMKSMTDNFNSQLNITNTNVTNAKIKLDTILFEATTAMDTFKEISDSFNSLDLSTKENLANCLLVNTNAINTELNRAKLAEGGEFNRATLAETALNNRCQQLEDVVISLLKTIYGSGISYPYFPKSNRS